MDFTKDGQVIAQANPITEGQAPDFTLTDLKGQSVTLSKLTKPVLISVFPDINTSVCHIQTKRFNMEAAKEKEIDFLSISNNTAEEQRNWCAAEDVDMTILADDGSFGEAYGLKMTNLNRLARAVYVVKDGQIIYSEILSEITQEPDYDKAIAAAKN